MSEERSVDPIYVENAYRFRRPWTRPGPGGTLPNGPGGLPIVQPPPAGDPPGAGAPPGAGSRNPAGPPPGGGSTNGHPILVFSSDQWDFPGDDGTYSTTQNGQNLTPPVDTAYFGFSGNGVPLILNAILQPDGFLHWVVTYDIADSFEHRWAFPIRIPAGSVSPIPQSGIYTYVGNDPGNEGSSTVLVS